jgi:hypothetical protein
MRGPSFSLWRGLAQVSLGAALVLALAYLGQVARIAPDHSAEELPFVLLLLAGGVVALVLGGRLQHWIARFFDHAQPGSGETRRRQIYEAPATFATAVLFAGCVGFFVWLKAPWSSLGTPPAPQATQLDLMLVALIALCNLPVGLAIGALPRFWIAAQRYWQAADLHILQLNRPDLSLYKLINGAITAGAAIMTALSQIGLQFSTMQPDLAILAYTLFSLMIILACWAAPLLALASKLYFAKSEALDQIDSQIKATMTAPDTAAPLDQLLLQRSHLASINVFPPGSPTSISASAGVVALALLPALVDYVLTL